MKAIIHTQYGGTEVLKLREIETPIATRGQILVRIMANSVNPADWRIMRGEPHIARLAFGLFRPSFTGFGADFAGEVVAVGEAVTGFNIGDRVFGEGRGAFAAYYAVSAELCSHIPSSVGFLEAASLPMAGLTAWQALTQQYQLSRGERVLINGSSGGVGHIMIQIARFMELHVTAVCSHRNVEFVKSLGADEVLPYDLIDIHKHNGNYDLVIDNHGNLHYEDFKRMAKKGVIVGFTSARQMIKLLLKSFFYRYPLKSFTASAKSEDLNAIVKLMEKEVLKVHVEKTFSYFQVSEALTYIEKMRTKGKVAIDWRIN